MIHYCVTYRELADPAALEAATTDEERAAALADVTPIEVRCTLADLVGDELGEDQKPTGRQIIDIHPGDLPDYAPPDSLRVVAQGVTPVHRGPAVWHEAGECPHFADEAARAAAWGA